MISINGLDYIKSICDIQADMTPGGVLYLAVEGDTFTWKKSSKTFDLDVFSVGNKISETSIIGRAMKEKRTIIENVPRTLYGTRLRTIAEPLVNDTGEVVGGFSIVYPRLHPLAKSFGDYAPILSEMFAEGVVIFFSDLEKLIYTQSSQKFDIPEMRPDLVFDEDSIPYKVIHERKPEYYEIDESKYGVPVVSACYPVFDEEDGSDLVGTFGVIVPKAVAAKIREVSKNLENGLDEIAAAIEQLASSASEIHENEQELNEGIADVTGMSEEIKEISSFIREIADETKMLGLNAAIEAARAGEAGKGFGVVANEIRKLSDESKSTVPKINKITDNIKMKIEEAGVKSKKSLTSSQEQAAATQEITASIEEINSMAAELNKIAEKL